ncbi:hypothetical protein BDK51DRAFT_27542, partial [Blyttiomyces helicus]
MQQPTAGRAGQRRKGNVCTLPMLFIAKSGEDVTLLRGATENVLHPREAEEQLTKKKDINTLLHMAASAAPDTRLLVSLITRVSEKLPVNSGLPLSFLDTDPLFNQNVAAIVELSEWRIREIASALASMLDGVAKASIVSSSSEDSQQSSEVFQSQLFVLRLLGTCLAHYWKCTRDAAVRGDTPAARDVDGSRASHLSREASCSSLRSSGPPSPRSARGISLSVLPRTNSGDEVATSAYNPAVRSGSSSAMDVRPRGGPAISRQRTTSSLSVYNEDHRLSFITSPTFHPISPNSSRIGSTVTSLSDPPVLDENLARFILGVITRFFFTSASSINSDTIGHSFSSFSSAPGYADHSASSSMSFSALSSFFLDHSMDDAAPAFSGRPLTSRTSLSSSASSFSTTSSRGAVTSTAALLRRSASPVPVTLGGDLLAEVHKAAGRILYYLSASNWSVVFTRVKARLLYLAQTGMTAPGQDVPMEREAGDLTELRFLEWCNLNRARLGMVIGELASLSKTFSKRAQFLAAIIIRRAIWNWIESYPLEFLALCQSQKKME